MPNILINARIRPLGANPQMASTQQAKPYKIDYNDSILYVNSPIPDRQPFSFKFNRIFDDTSTQEQVFNNVVKPFIPDFIKGVNCCVFAYGQTGSGKTYTQTGGAGSYNERGFMPRAIEEIFKLVRADETREYQVYASYLQIINEGGFDLLSKNQNINSASENQLEKVRLLEDSAGETHILNLSAHACKDVEAALNCLWSGDVNRLVTATSQNQASSRSHCIFTLFLKSRAAGSELVRQSKFHFVDLAGSERVGKTGADGLILEQAKYINGSLFFLEMVIRALAQKKEHVPYRNSLITLFLKDSIGGNSNTSLIATLGFEIANLAESISTCMFSMSVGQIKNSARVNEEVDLRILVRRLKEENQRLKEELKLLKEGPEASADKLISREQQEEIMKALRAFLQGQDETLDVGNYWKLQCALRLARQILAEGGARPAQEPQAASRPENDQEIARLKRLLQQRDAEIEVLTQMVGGGNATVAKSSIQQQITGPMYSYDTLEGEIRDGNVSAQSSRFEEARAENSASSTSIAEPPRPQGHDKSAFRPLEPTPPRVPALSAVQQQQAAAAMASPGNLCKIDIAKLNIIQLKEETSIFQKFINGYYRRAEIDQQKEDSKVLYAQAKDLARIIGQLRAEADGLKAQVLEVVKRAGQETEESDLLKSKLQQLAGEYKQSVLALKETKGQIEALDAEMAHSKAEIKKDFVRWYGHAVKLVSEREKTAGGADNVDDDIQAYYDMKAKMGL